MMDISAISANDLPLLIFVAAAAVALVLALVNLRNAGRAAAMVCLSVSIATAAMIVQGREGGLLPYIAGFALIATIALMSSNRRSGDKSDADDELQKPH
jgi:hypothetical protein